MKNSKQSGLPSLTQIRTLAKEAVFNPRTPGPMSIVADVNSQEYLTNRAVEEIRMAQNLHEAAKKLTKRTASVEGQYQTHLNTAIRLLLLARARAQ